MLKHFHITNQCSTFVDFMVEFYCYLKVLMFFNEKYNGLVGVITWCAPFVMWQFMIISRTLWCILLVWNMFKINKHDFCNHFFKMYVNIWIFFLDVNWKHRSNLFETTLVTIICICLHVRFQCGWEEHYVDTWKGYLPLGLNYLDVSKKRNQSVIISKNMIFEWN
jgi:hypothetical protein